MTNQAAPAYFCSNTIGRIIYVALEEVLGGNGVNETLKNAELANRVGKYPPNDRERQVCFTEISSIQHVLEHQYGERSGRGLALRLGRVSFKYWLREFGGELNLNSTAFRLLPTDVRLSQGIEACARVINQLSDQQVSLLKDDQHYYWSIGHCPVCWSRKTNGPACHQTVGFLDELLSWLSGGRRYRVEETHCEAAGDRACVMRLDRFPSE